MHLNRYSVSTLIHLIIVWVIDRNLAVSFHQTIPWTTFNWDYFDSSHSITSSLARVNLDKISDSIAARDCSVQRTYLVQDTPLDTSYPIPQHTVTEANLIISDQQANFRGGNIRLEEIGWGGEEGGAAKLPWKLAFRLAHISSIQITPFNILQSGSVFSWSDLTCWIYWPLLRFYALKINLAYAVWTQDQSWSSRPERRTLKCSIMCSLQHSVT